MRASPLASLLGEKTILENTILLPGCHTLWVEARSPDDWTSGDRLVVDLARWKVIRRVAERSHATRLLRGSSSRILTTDEERFQVFLPSGQEEPTGWPPLPIEVDEATLTPDGLGILAAGPSLLDLETQEDTFGHPLYLAELRTGQGIPRVDASPVAGSTASATSALATSLDEKTSFFLNFHEGELFCRVVAPAPGDPVPVPAEVLLAQDAASRRVAMACWWGERFAVVPLSRETA